MLMTRCWLVFCHQGNTVNQWTCCHYSGELTKSGEDSVLVIDDNKTKELLIGRHHSTCLYFPLIDHRPVDVVEQFKCLRTFLQL